ncbi:MAG: hypothetical protein IPG85_07760 [Bacteroidetes bacterium]|nr:hypothetical protein [Bacteroidota bacterium]
MAGEWKSADIGFVTGKIVVNLPNELPLDTLLTVDVLVYYDIWSFYNIGGTREFTLTGMITKKA